MGLPLAVKRARNLAFRRTNLKLLAVSRKSVMGKKKRFSHESLKIACQDVCCVYCLVICYLQFTIAVSYINLNIIVIAIIYNNSN